MEVWASIVGHPYYEISSFGRVRSLHTWRGKRGRIRSCQDNGNGYRFIQLWAGGRYTSLYIHRLVAVTFLDNPHLLPEVNHRDGDKHNNNSTNLEWVTKAENGLHKTRVLKRHKNKRLYLAWRAGEQPFLIDNLAQFASEHGLSQGNCTTVAQGKHKQTKGWHFAYADQEEFHA